MFMFLTLLFVKVPLFDWPYPEMNLLNNDRRLEILNAQVDDAGVYTCQATNPAGQLKQDFVLEVFGKSIDVSVSQCSWFYVLC